MRYLFAAVLLLFCMSAYGQTLTIDEAIVENMKYLSENLSSGTRVIILNIESEYKNLSKYIINKSGVFIMNNTKLTLMGKNKLPNILRKKKINDLNEIDEAAALEIGKELGASQVIFGDISKLGEIYRFRVYTLGVSYGEIQGMQTLNVKEDEILTDLIKKDIPFDAKTAPQTPTVAKRDAGFEDLSNLRSNGGFGDSQSAQAKLEAETGGGDWENSQIGRLAKEMMEIKTEEFGSQSFNASSLTQINNTTIGSKLGDKNCFLLSFKSQIYIVKFLDDRYNSSYQYVEQKVKVPAFSFEIGGVTRSGFRYDAIFDCGRDNLGFGAYLGKQTYGKIFRFNSGTDLGLWRISTQSIEKISASATYGRVKQNLMFGGPRIGFMLGYNFVFLDFNMKCLLGIRDMHDITEYSYNSLSGFWENFGNGYDFGFSAVYLWNIGLTFMF